MKQLLLCWMTGAVLSWVGAANGDDGVIWVDLVQSLPRATVKNSPSTQMEDVRSGGVLRPSIFQHPAGPDSPGAEIVFLPFHLPDLSESLKRIEFRASLGFRDGDAFTKAGSDGCEFVVVVDGAEVLRQPHAQQQWKDVSIDLSKWAGREVSLGLQTLPRRHASADWAAWAEPRIELIGEASALRVKLREAVDLPPHWPIAKLLQRASEPRYAARATEGAWVGVLDRELDLDFATRIYSPAVKRTAPLPPKLVVGQGADPSNHTLVRVLSEYGVVESQFLAFPPSVRGGVYVEALRDEKGALVIAATPISEPTGVIRIFTSDGALLNQWKPFKDESLLTITSGNFDDEVGEELAMARIKGDSGASNTSNHGVIICDAWGTRLIENHSISLYGPRVLTSRMARPSDRGRDEAMVYFPNDRELRSFELDKDSEKSQFERFKFSLLANECSVHGSAFDADRFWASGPKLQRGFIYNMDQNGSFTRVSADEEERRFWIALPKEFEEDFGPLRGLDTAKHIRVVKYGHLRVDAMAPRYQDPSSNAPATPALHEILKNRGLLAPLKEQPLQMWNPCFTHRSFASPFLKWAKAKEAESDLPVHMMQSPLGGMDGFSGETASAGLISATYAPGDKPLQSLYIESLRAFLQVWAPLCRAAPGQMPSLEPNHEHEIAIAAHGSVGDYNPAMIEGFFQWLVNRYGSQVSVWEKPLGVRFSEGFDAPRGAARGSWDRYSMDNPYFVEWIEFNRHVVNRALSATYREALLAGVPPELIHCHQIPDQFAVGPPLKGVTRISPIDYAMTAGVNFGFTRFGSTHPRRQNIVKASAESGFENFVMGEFQPLTTDAENAERELRYVFNHGAKAIHVLHWGDKHRGEEAPTLESVADRRKNQVVYDAIQRLILDDPSRPQAAFVADANVESERDGNSEPAAGDGMQQELTGVGPMRRGWMKSLDLDKNADNPTNGNDKEHPVQIVAINPTGPALLKSVNEQGEMEGSIYVTPFRQQIDVKSVDVETISRGVLTMPAQDLTPGSQIDVAFMVAANQPTLVKVVALRNGVPLPRFEASYTIQGERHLRYQLRSPERAPNIELTIRVGAANVKYLHATVQTPQFADIHAGQRTGKPHRGGVTFDVASQ